MHEIGRIESLYRYPVKSMRGESLPSAELGLHGIDGDRRFAVRRVINDQSGFPWLTASQLFELLRYTPIQREHDLYVRTPDGRELPIFSKELEEEISARYGNPVEISHQRHGIFDDANLSIITLDTVAEIARQANVSPDARRFRPNLVLRLTNPTPFQEDSWFGGTLTFGDDAKPPRVSLVQRDVRCGVINLDPDTAKSTPAVLKSVFRSNQNCAGIYATIIWPGQLTVGQPIYFERY